MTKEVDGIVYSTGFEGMPSSGVAHVYDFEHDDEFVVKLQSFVTGDQSEIVEKIKEGMELTYAIENGNPVYVTWNGVINQEIALEYKKKFLIQTCNKCEKSLDFTNWNKRQFSKANSGKGQCKKCIQSTKQEDTIINLQTPKRDKIEHTIKNLKTSEKKKKEKTVVNKGPIPVTSGFKSQEGKRKALIQKRKNEINLHNEKGCVYFSYPELMSIIEDEHSLDKLNFDLEQKDLIVVLFKDDKINGKSQPPQHDIKKIETLCDEIKNKLEEKFFKSSIHELRSFRRNGRVELNFIQHITTKIWVITNQRHDCTSQTVSGAKCKQSTTHYSRICHQHRPHVDASKVIVPDSILSSICLASFDDLIKRSKNRWTILGDETGSVSMPSSHEIENDDGMSWIVVPPQRICSERIPPLHLNFHSAGSYATYDRQLGQTNLASNDKVLKYYFQGSKEQFEPSINPLLGRDRHLRYWAQTLPFVLEHISSKIEKDDEVDIFVENVGDLSSGIGVLDVFLQDLVQSMNKRGRKSWKNVKFNETWVLAKDEHPWLGYPDAHCHSFRKTALNSPYDLQDNLDNVITIRDQTIHVPYDGDDLDHVSNILLQKPFEMLRSITELSSDQLKHCVIPFFRNTITDAFEQLTSKEWHRFLSIGSDSKLNQDWETAGNVNYLIKQIDDYDKISRNLENLGTRFEFWMTIYGVSNHLNDIQHAEHCQRQIEEIISQGYKPPTHRIKDRDNHTFGQLNNMFDFSYLDNNKYIDDESNENELDPSTCRLMGTISVGFALRGTENDIEKSYRIEKMLTNTQWYEDSFSEDKERRQIYLTELQLMDPTKSKSDTLGLIKEIYESSPESRNLPYILAAFLKALVLFEEKDENIFQEAKNILKTSLLIHPMHRIAYWCFRYSIEAQQETKSLIQFLKRMRHVPHFNNDVLGVMLSCYLTDIEKRTGKDCGAVNFQSKVLKESRPSTIDWFNKCKQIDNTLSPLNFNIR